MTRDDPFGLDDDAGRTRIRPARQARGPATMAARPGTAGEAAPRVQQLRASANPLVNAFAALLGLAPELERAMAPENPETLRARLLDNLIHARDAAVGEGVPLSRADQAAWFVAALLDDVALNTPWGGHSDWPREPLVVSLSGDVDAGTRFFERAEDLLRYSERDPDMLELAFLCLGLGFRGKHRVTGPAGDGALAQMRGAMARVLRRPDDADRALSPHWQGVAAADEAPRFRVPLWSIALVALAAITLIYAGLSMRLSSRGEQLFTLASVLPPPERAGIYRPLRETAVPETPALIAEPVVMELLPLFAGAAPPDALGALTGREDVSLAILALQSPDPELFRSARAEINEVYAPLIAAIAQVIVDNLDVIGGVRVVGHTDSVPVQRTNPFASNQGLSEARARTIADLLIARGVPPGLIAHEGRAATQPIADNATREGRARNRRVEIHIEKKV
ncbi:type IVB secretion system protein IcmH/DotU [Rhodovulum tesquicola]|uniref:type IVB secretion system protein IcmH/DotU n=1 Tax=Rhodovulum tesquicola TaxID=540254 RepID=UPI0020980F48|nr:type IVB secretion system protein IcmH/DotU [Rhodovulum tesquicola]MCO8144965.1 type IVB secretion system protein IcmH/DotU [Rhodovulum tesquicola]